MPPGSSPSTAGPGGRSASTPRCGRRAVPGPGPAAAAGTASSALLSLALMLRPRYRGSHATLSGWRFDPELFRRLLRYGFPNGLFAALDALAFTVFVLLVGRLGDVELSATSIT